MGTPKQTVSVLFIFSIILFLCFFNKCDIPSIISLLSDIYQLINRRNMILLCNFILLFIVNDSGLLSPGRNELSELSVYKENRVALLEKEREFEVKEVQLEKEEEIREIYIDRSLDIVVIENRNEVIETNEEEEQMEIMESSREEEVCEVIQRREVEEELEKECVCVIEQNGEDEMETESVEELNKKFEEFIGKMKRQMGSEISFGLNFELKDKVVVV